MDEIKSKLDKVLTVKVLGAIMNLNKNDPEDVSMSRLIIQHFHAPYYYDSKKTRTLFSIDLVVSFVPSENYFTHITSNNFCTCFKTLKHF